MCITFKMEFLNQNILSIQNYHNATVRYFNLKAWNLYKNVKMNSQRRPCMCKHRSQKLLLTTQKVWFSFISYHAVLQTPIPISKTHHIMRSVNDVFWIQNMILKVTSLHLCMWELTVYLPLHSQHRIFCYLTFSCLLHQWMSCSLSSSWSSCASKGDLLGLYIKNSLYIWIAGSRTNKSHLMRRVPQRLIQTHILNECLTTTASLIYILLRE